MRAKSENISTKHYLVVLSPELWYPLLLLKPDILIQVDLEEAEKLLLPSPPPALTISSSGPGPDITRKCSREELSQAYNLKQVVE